MIEPYPGGALGKEPAQQAQMLRDRSRRHRLCGAGGRRPTSSGTTPIVGAPRLVPRHAGSHLGQHPVGGIGNIAGLRGLLRHRVACDRAGGHPHAGADRLAGGFARQAHSRQQSDRSLGAGDARHVPGRAADRQDARGHQPRHHRRRRDGAWTLARFRSRQGGDLSLLPAPGSERALDPDEPGEIRQPPQGRPGRDPQIQRQHG